MRAGIMGMIGLYAARRRLLKDGLHILSVAALAMLVWNPYFLVNVSFQLSFIVTAGLMIFVPKLMPLLTFLPRWLGYRRHNGRGAADLVPAHHLLFQPGLAYFRFRQSDPCSGH